MKSNTFANLTIIKGNLEEMIPEKYRQYFSEDNDFISIYGTVFIPVYQVIENSQKTQGV